MTQLLEIPSPVIQHHRRAIKFAPRRVALPPAIVLGGRANALSVVRSISKLGADVYVLNEPDAFVASSRHCRQLDVPVPHKGGEAQAWAKFLLSEEAEHLHGAVLLSCGDEGISMIAEHRDALAERYLLDDSNPRAQLLMLNKLATYRQAIEAGVPTPKFWVAESAEQVEAAKVELVYPLIVKPRLSHVFENQTGKKLIVAETFDEVVAAVKRIAATGTQSVLMEMIPGPDDRLCSYFTYLDEDSRPMFAFTKRIIRRYPLLMGTACYHITDWIPEAAELGNRLFRHVGLRGLANVEFKRDERDGQLKLIECNARFTASDCLVSRAGVDLATFVYNRITGRPLPTMKQSQKNLRLWDPLRDFQAYLALRKTGQLSFPGWLRSVMHRQSFAYFRWSDPVPAIARLTLPLRQRLGLARAH